MKKIIPLFLAVSLVFTPAFAEGDAPPANDQSFSAWMDDFKSEASSQGISQQTLENAFAQTQPIERVIALDHKQPESHLTLDEYLENTVTTKRIHDGKMLMEENRALLDKVSREYGVQAQFIVALWGIETNYGHNTGGFRTVDALATLAYDGRRSEYFRAELINALKILDAEHMSADDMKGSWAGALGQCQFMPTSFLQFAVDYNGDGHRDIWQTKSDVFASIANYLKSSGWDGDEGWGGPVELPDHFNRKLADIKQSRTLSQLNKLGVRKSGGTPLPQQDNDAYLIMVGEGEDATPYVVYGNYKVLLKWNRSRFFATAVSTLADRIGK